LSPPRRGIPAPENDYSPPGRGRGGFFPPGRGKGWVTRSGVIVMRSTVGLLSKGGVYLTFSLTDRVKIK